MEERERERDGVRGVLVLFLMGVVDIILDIRLVNYYWLCWLKFLLLVWIMS